MSDTLNTSLLDRLRARDEPAWYRLLQLFGPLVDQWVRRGGVPEADTQDVVQEVFVGVANGVAEFRRDHDRATFRGWLRRIAQHKVQDHFRRRANRPVAEGGTDAHLRLAQAPEEEPADDAPDAREKDELVRRGLELIREEFAPKTWQAFLAVGLNGRPAADVATELGMTVGAIYVAKSRVLKRLGQELDGLF